MLRQAASFRRFRGIALSFLLWAALSQTLAAADLAAPDAPPPDPPTADAIEPVVPEASPRPEAQPLAFKEVYERTLAASVWIINRSADGQQIATGTGWVVDAQRRLIVTNEHVVSLSDDVLVFFPEYIDGKLQTNKDYYLRKLRPVEGRAIDSDTVKDLALIQVETMPDEVKSLALAEDSPSIADQVHSVGAAPEGSEGLWIYSHGRVRSVVQRTLANGHQAMTVESDMPTNRGNSGGAVVNDFGDVVAVVEGHMINARLVSLYIDVTEVRTFLDEALPLVEAQSSEDLIKRGQRHLAERRYLSAISDFTAALKLTPDVAEANAGRGWGFYHEGDYETALIDLNEALRLDGTLVNAYYGRGMVEREMGKHDEAIADFTNAIRFDPMHSDSYNERGVTYFRMQDYAKAETDFSRALQRNTGDGRLFANRGDARQNLGKNAEAIDDFLKAIEIEPENDEYYNYLGVSLYRLQRYEDAGGAFLKAIELNGQDAMYCSNLCDCLQMLGKYQESLIAITRAIEINPANSYFHASRGYSLQQLKSFEMSLADYNEAIRLQNNVAWYYVRRAEVQEALGNHDLARADHQMAAKLDPASYGATTHQVSAISHSNLTQSSIGSAVVGRWRYQGSINGVRVDVRAHLSESGSFAYVWRTYLGDGRYSDITERGSYTLGGNTIVFATGEANYMYPYASGGDSLTLRFTEEAITLKFYREG